MPRSTPGFGLALWLAALAAGLAGCGTPGYYWQAVTGHADLMARRVPVPRLVEDPQTPTELKSRLLLARQICAFAESELSLDSNGHYQHYADLGRAYVVWNIYAAREFSLDAREWWYPFVGRLDYRGYFRETTARRYAARLEARGWETHVEGASAYSTLGWFRDPLLNTFLHAPEPALAETIFHELAHQRVFVPGDTEFNEAFATVVGREGARRWLRSQGREDLLAEWEQSLVLEQRCIALALTARRELQWLYESHPDTATSDEQRDLVRQARRTILDRLRRELNIWIGGGADPSPHGASCWNNARLNSLATYYELVPAFEALLKVHGEELEAFYQSVERLGKLPASRRLDALRQKAGVESVRVPGGSNQVLDLSVGAGKPPGI